jgi:hypothetical protein
MLGFATRTEGTDGGRLVTTTAQQAGPGGSGPGRSATDRYLDLLKGCLTRELFYDEEVVDVLPSSAWPYGSVDEFWAMLDQQGWRLVRRADALDDRVEGRDYPPNAETMIGRARLDHLQEAVTTILREDVPGDLVETGVWRGGAVAFMKAVLDVHGDEDRHIWACDSFQGLPEPDVERYPADRDLVVDDPRVKTLMDVVLAIPVERVKANIARYGLLDDRIHFLEGWFKDTLPDAPIERIALLRLDGDLYESTMDVLTTLEEKVVPGGFVVVDDYHSIEACEAAVTDYRERHGITDPIHDIDWTGVWWRKSPR